MSIWPGWIGEATGGPGGYVLIEDFGAEIEDEDIVAEIDLGEIIADIIDDEIEVDLV